MIDGRWQEAELGELPIDNGVRLRGAVASRLDTFVDAAFAFAVTLLVISVDKVPDSYPALIEALTQVPAFLACFALLMSFWWGHHVWSRRYGMQSSGATVLSLALVALVLIYVYPLRVIFGAFFADFTGGALAATLEPTLAQLGTLFVVFGLGFAAMSGTILALYLHALRHWETLLLDELERFQTAGEAVSWAVLTATGLLSCLVAWWLPDAAGPAAGYVYWSLIVTMPLTGYLVARSRRQRFGGTVTSPAASTGA